MDGNPLKDKTYKFAVTIAKLCLEIQKEQKEYVLTRQLLKSGTSIAANSIEAQGGQSRKDFLAKISISYKEALETQFWINLMTDLNLISSQSSQDLLKDLLEILKILGKIKVSTRKNLLKSL